MKRIGTYRGKYGRLKVNFAKHKVLIDELDRDKIWRDSNKDYRAQQIIYSEIIDELLGEDAALLAPPSDDSFWAGDYADFGFKVYLYDGWTLQVDSDGTFFIEP